MWELSTMYTTGPQMRFSQLKHDIPAIKELLRGSRMFGESEIYYFQEVNSTNSWLGEKNCSNVSVCLAEQQTSGKGRLGRHWVSEASGSILMSFCFPMEASKAYGLSLLSGMAVLSVLQSKGVSGLSLKWPNDVLLGRRKLAGILVEIAGSNIVVGIGINVNLPQSSGNAIDQPWTDLASEGFNLSRDELVAEILLQHEDGLDKFIQDGFKEFAYDWNQHDAFAGQYVSASHHQRKIQGVAMGVNKYGEYLVKMDDQTPVAINSGEIIWGVRG